ncbi:MAG: hypothetical protein FWB85_11660 [Chitinispirillia bacterium]|nr:hypothetical protein [Chitinispirillia bacterium]MCL2242748.1 hypothetical protein [Chitinispirillia bacterium]
MELNIKRAIPVILLSLGTLFLSCCTCTEMCTTITYEVTGTPRDDIEVQFFDGLGTLDAYPSIRLPWKLTFNVQSRGDEYQDGKHPNGKFTAYIAASSPAHLVDLTVSIYAGGNLVQTGHTTKSRDWARAYYQVDL